MPLKLGNWWIITIPQFYEDIFVIWEIIVHGVLILVHVM